MSDSIYSSRQNIVLDNDTYAILERDTRMFHVMGAHHRPSINHLVNLVLVNYFDEFQTEKTHFKDQAMRTISNLRLHIDQSNELVAALADNCYLLNTEREKRTTRTLNLRITNENMWVLSSIADNMSKTSTLSNTISQILTNYTTLPAYARERIVFKSEYEKIMHAVSHKHKISFITKTKPDFNHEVIPYGIEKNKEEAFNYLLCVEKYSDNRPLSTMSYHLWNISQLREGHEASEIPAGFLQHLQEMEEYPQFSINNSEEIIIKMDKEGLRQYNSIPTLRPRIEKITETQYRVLCGTNQASQYFRRFNCGVEIITPEELREEFKEMYKRLAKLYE